RLDLARRVAEAHENTVRPQAVERLIEARSANRIVDDRDAAVRKLANAARNVVAVEQHVLAAVRESDLALRWRADDADHARPELARPLSCDEADAARRRVQQDPVSGRDLVAALQQVPSRQALQH